MLQKPIDIHNDVMTFTPLLSRHSWTNNQPARYYLHDSQPKDSGFKSQQQHLAFLPSAELRIIYLYLVTCFKSLCPKNQHFLPLFFHLSLNRSQFILRYLVKCTDRSFDSFSQCLVKSSLYFFYLDSHFFQCIFRSLAEHLKHCVHNPRIYLC